MGIRFVALDRLRALAVVAMVQGHTFTALMAEDALPRGLMQVHALVHGLTAPAFLFGAGLAFGLATYPRYAQHHRGGSALGPRLRRYLWLVLLGYALQLPGASLLAALRMPLAELTPVFRVGPLHLIALCLSVCQLAALLARSARMHVGAALLLGFLIVACAPWVYSVEAGRAAGPVLGAWLDASTGSLFPIFPWASFVFLGVGSGGLLVLRGAEIPRAARWLGLGLCFAGTAYLLFRLGVRLCEPRWFWYASPLTVLFRIGMVLALLGVLHAAPVARGSVASTGWTALLARHSLIAFVVHLLLLYGTPFTPNLARRYGLQLSAPQATLVFVAIMAVTMLAILAWARLRDGRELAHGWARAVLTVLGVLVLMR